MKNGAKSTPFQVASIFFSMTKIMGFFCLWVEFKAKLCILSIKATEIFNSITSLTLMSLFPKSSFKVGMKLRSFIDLSEANSLQPYLLVFYLTLTDRCGSHPTNSPKPHPLLSLHSPFTPN